MKKIHLIGVILILTFSVVFCTEAQETVPSHEAFSNGEVLSCGVQDFGTEDHFVNLQIMVSQGRVSINGIWGDMMSMFPTDMGTPEDGKSDSSESESEEAGNEVADEELSDSEGSSGTEESAGEEAVADADLYINGKLCAYIDAPNRDEGTLLTEITINERILQEKAIEKDEEGNDWSALCGVSYEMISGKHELYFVFVSDEEGEICMLNRFTVEKAEYDALYRACPHVNSYQLVEEDSVEATDTEGGHRHYKCSVCGAEYAYNTDPLVYETNPKTGEAVTLEYAANPYVPTWERLTDNELHVVWSREDSEWRVYSTGSHDADEGTSYCGHDMVVWSAPVYDLSDWRFESVVRNTGVYFAGDLNYDLYSDQALVLSAPFLGCPDLYKLWTNGTSSFKEFFDTPYQIDGIIGLDTDQVFDPAIYIEGKEIYFVFSGDETSILQKLNEDHTALEFVARLDLSAYPEALPFYEASSFDYMEDYGVYVWQYSGIDERHDNYFPLCCWYTVDTDLATATWHYAGVISDNSNRYRKDAGSDEITYHDDALMSWDNNHGGLVKINGDWYVSNHRHSGLYASRQGFLEKLNVSFENQILTILPTEYTSSIGDAITAYNNWPAAIACIITPAHSYNEQSNGQYSHICYVASVRDGEDYTATVYYDMPELYAHRTPVIGICNDVTVGYQYLNFGEDADHAQQLSILVAREKDYVGGKAQVYIDAPNDKDGVRIAEFNLTKDVIDSASEKITAVHESGIGENIWSKLSAECSMPITGIHSVYFVFSSEDEGTICKMDEFAFIK